jgi:peptide/nickel transport system permease protein
MTSIVNTETLITPRKPRRKHMGPGTWVAFCYIGLLIFVAIFSPWIAPYGLNEQDPINALQGPSWAHWLGTDDVGRDVLSRLMFAAGPALTGVLISIAVTATGGVTWGLLAGTSPRWLDNILMRISDIVQAFPSLILAMAITAALGVNLTNAMIALGIAHIPDIARLTRAGALTTREREFVRITQLYGRSRVHSAFLHVLPNVFAPVLVQLVIFCGLSLITQTSLSFLGLGDPPPAAARGESISSAFRYILSVPTATIAPGLVVAFAVLSIYQLGDELRARLDVPRTSRRKKK